MTNDQKPHQFRYDDVRPHGDPFGDGATMSTLGYLEVMNTVADSIVAGANSFPRGDSMPTRMTIAPPDMFAEWFATVDESLDLSARPDGITFDSDGLTDEAKYQLFGRWRP